MKKALALLVLLSLPVLIFLFLKFYGFNEYEVPVYPINGSSECLSDSITLFSEGKMEEVSVISNKFISNSSTAYTVIAVLNEQVVNSMETHLMQTTRVYDVFSQDGDFKMLTLVSPNRGMHIIEQYVQSRKEHVSAAIHWEIGHFVNSDQYRAFVECKMGIDPLEENVNLILIDPSGRVRGYYNSLDEDETERLILELRILRRTDI